MSRKPKTLSKLKKELDKVYSRYIRLREADENGFTQCVTCGVAKHWKDGMQAGHFCSRRYLSLRFDERQVWPQCISCNMYHEGNMVSYAIFMQKKFGPDILEQLEKEKRQTVKYDRDWYKEKIAYYKEKVKELE